MEPVKKLELERSPGTNKQTGTRKLLEPTNRLEPKTAGTNKQIKTKTARTRASAETNLLKNFGTGNSWNHQAREPNVQRAFKTKKLNQPWDELTLNIELGKVLLKSIKSEC